MLHVCFIHKSRSERSTDPDPKSVAQESGSPKLRVCRSMMQEPMMGHLTLLGSPVPSAVGSPERRGSTGPKPRVSRSIMRTHAHNWRIVTPRVHLHTSQKPFHSLTQRTNTCILFCGTDCLEGYSGPFRNTQPGLISWNLILAGFLESHPGWLAFWLC